MPLGSTYIFYSLAGRGPGSLAPCKQAPAATIYARLRPLPPPHLRPLPPLAVPVPRGHCPFAISTGSFTNLGT